MDLATLVGLIGGMAFVIMAMVLGGSIMMFVDVVSVLIVVGGSVFVVLMKFEMGQFFRCGPKSLVKPLCLKLMLPKI